MDFYDLDLDDKILDAVDANNYTECTPIQEKTIPAILEGHDVLGVAQTGTGKTAAYLLPIIQRLYQSAGKAEGIRSIIMAPTRELAHQIDQAMEGFSYFVPLSSLAIYGGNDGIRFEQESRSLRLGADMIVATPGRLLAHIQLENPDFSQVKFFVLDEADRLLDMGFYDDIMSIAQLLPDSCQKIMFSATMPDKIRQLSLQLLRNPVEVRIAVSKPADTVKQYVCYASESAKTRVICDLFARRPDLNRVIIFASSKKKVKALSIELQKMKINVAEMHSDLDQKKREETMMDFRNNHISVLVATDIISRGIDIDDINLIINYDVPSDPEDYVHRVGRTARAGRGGYALTLVCNADRGRLKDIIRLTGNNLTKYDIPTGLAGEEKEDERGEKRASGNRRRNSHRRSGNRKPRNGRRGDNKAQGSASHNNPTAEKKQ